MPSKRAAKTAECCDVASCCPPRPPLAERPLLSFVEAVDVMALLKVLANDTRIRLLHHLIRNGEANVSDLAQTLGMRQQAVSNQLARLSDTRIVASRRDGNNIYYRIADRCVPLLLDQALCIMEDQHRLRPAQPRG
jgi:ArsR family transcriptional regulator, lead/cadmium/zinc/bismuth-responsive transcriptional repressor